MHCDSCVSKVQQALNNLEAVDEVTVSLSGQVANITGRAEVEVMLEAISKIGYKASLINKVDSKDSMVNEDLPESDLQKLFPLFLIFLYISIASIGINFPNPNSNELMLDFMGLFYIVFSFFKFLDYKNFPRSFAMYDPIAMRVPFYGWVYPFIEVTFGILILFRIGLFSIIIITIAMLGVTSIGVTKVLSQKRNIQCACLGTALKLPMTKATFIENGIMILMALSLLFSQSI
jgi:copper chaperone CopZ|tara:strand:+ start:12092 stop:12790 length:699 start_codon:yes stop_codon:yes gene_type:complete